MLKKEYDRLKRERKALIAREYQDLPVVPSVTKVQVQEPVIHPSPNTGYGTLFYTGILATAVIVLLIAI